MKTTLKEFPFNNRGKAASFPVSDLKTALDWKERFEEEIRGILVNLEKENNNLKMQQEKDRDIGLYNSVDAAEGLIIHNSGRIFSLKQILGDLP